MIEELTAWFLAHQRTFPWREERTPYRVWISEIMLQQTQASVVIPYFERWMRRFPSVRALAEATLEEVIKMWEGLGYYSRARHLHEAACYLVTYHGGELPEEEEALSKIKGLGPYTAGAILNFAFHKRAPAIDANVKRVLSRFFGRADRELLMQLLPEKEPWVFSEALIELGALICKKKPECDKCPLKKECPKLPFSPPSRKQTCTLHRLVGIITFQDLVLVQKERKGKVMADLYQFPYIEIEKVSLDSQSIKKLMEEKWEIELHFLSFMKREQHSFTHYRAFLYPCMLQTEKRPEKGEWKTREELKKLPFSSGHRRVLNQFFHHENITH